MQPSPTRLVCRSHNPFTPSIALWQHFVLSNRPFRYQQRLSSSASTELESATDSPSDIIEANPPSAEPSGLCRSENGKEGSRGVVRRVEIRTKSQQNLFNRTRRAFDNSEDYKGAVVLPKRPQPDWVKRTKRLPAFLRLGRANVKGFDKLDLEIKTFHEFAKPTRLEALARRQLVEQVRNHARKYLPDDVLELFGSERTGLSLATSDIDLRLLTPEIQKDAAGVALPPSRSKRAHLLQKLYTLRSGLVGQQEYISCMLRHARYPLLAMRDRKSGLDVQIVLSNDTSISRNIVASYMQETPYLRELYSVVKTMFEVRGLEDVFMGGFGSYSLFMMTVASIRHKPPRRPDAAGGLMSFLEFWSSFDTSTHGVSIEPVELFNKHAEPVMPEKLKAQLENDQNDDNILPKYLLCLRDPADPTNDLGRKGIAIKHVQATCKHLFSQLTTFSKERDPEVLQTTTFLKVVVGPAYNLNKRKREILEAQGQNILSTVKQAPSSLAIKAQQIRQAMRDRDSKEQSPEAPPVPEPVTFRLRGISESRSLRLLRCHP